MILNELIKMMEPFIVFIENKGYGHYRANSVKVCISSCTSVECGTVASIQIADRNTELVSGAANPSGT